MERAAPIIIGIILLITAVNLAVYLRMYLQARLNGVAIGFFDLIGMALRKSRPSRTIVALITAKHGSVDLTHQQLETHTLAGGDIMRVVFAMVAARDKGFAVDWESVAALDLVGHDPLDVVERYDIEVAAPAGGKSPLDYSFRQFAEDELALNADPAGIPALQKTWHRR